MSEEKSIPIFHLRLVCTPSKHNLSMREKKIYTMMDCETTLTKYPTEKDYRRRLTTEYHLRMSEGKRLNKTDCDITPKIPHPKYRKVRRVQGGEGQRVLQPRTNEKSCTRRGGKGTKKGNGETKNDWGKVRGGVDTGGRVIG